ncbi:MAG: hypothetical protein RIG61_00705 [Deltaproteobacteria bacterium]
MRRKIEFMMLFYLSLFAVHYCVTPAFAVGEPVDDSFGTGDGSSAVVQKNNDLDGAEVAMAGPPRYTEAELTSVGGEIFINPQYTGKVSSVRTIDQNGLLGQKIGVEVRIMTDGWRKFSLPQELSGSYGVIVSGEDGILKISRPDDEKGPSGAVGSVHVNVVEFGSLGNTFTFPAQNVLEPSKYEIGILNSRDNSFINGRIIAMKSDQLAAEFGNLPPDIVNEDGNMRVSLKKPDGTFINADLPAWGYNLLVPETDVGTPAPITAEVFGLPDDAEIRFDFTSLSGQVIDPSTKILTVGEINKESTVSTITTKVGGAQPLTVLVKRVR